MSRQWEGKFRYGATKIGAQTTSTPGYSARRNHMPMRVSVAGLFRYGAINLALGVIKLKE